MRTTLIVALALMLLAPAASTAETAGRATAVRVYAATAGDRAGEIEVRVIARYPARDVDAGRGPFYGYTEVELQGPGGSLRLHDLDRLAHPRHAEQFDHRIEVSPSRARRLLDGRRDARIRVATRSVVLGPRGRSTRAAAAALARAPGSTQVVRLREVVAFPPVGGRLLATGGSLSISFALEPGTNDTYAPEVSMLQPPRGRALIPGVPADGVLMVDPAPPGDAPFSAAFAYDAPLPGGCVGRATGTIDGIVSGYGGILDFTNARFTATWSSMAYAWPLCGTPTSGTFTSLSQSWMDLR